MLGNNTKTIIISIVSVLAVILLGVFIVQGSRNKAIAMEETIEQSKSDIDVQIDRKINLLTELAECVKHYDEHEYNTLMDVIAARNEGSNAGDVNATEIVNQVKVVAEAYPELKSQENYVTLMNNISETENLLAQHKKACNSAIRNYRSYVRSFPARSFLGMAGYEVIDYELYQTTSTDTTMTLF